MLLAQNAQRFHSISILFAGFHCVWFAALGKISLWKEGEILT
jgi:hypothetical protein